MSLDLAASPSTRPTHRLDRVAQPSPLSSSRWRLPAAALLTAAVFAWGFCDRDLSVPEARLAVAAQHGLTPLGAVFGGWSPEIPVGSLAASRLTLLVLGPDALSWPGLVHLPQLLATLALAALTHFWVSRQFGRRIGFAAALALLASVGWLDRFSSLRLDVYTALALTLLLDQILRRGSTWIAGLALALSFAVGGLPAVGLGLLIVLLLGRRAAYVSARLLIPPIALIAAWSAWTLATVPASAWAVALLGPFREPPAWLTTPAALGLALPWTPFLPLAASRSLRDAWTPPQRDLLGGWSQAALVAALTGSIVPGFGPAALSILLCALVVLSVITFGSALTLTHDPRVRRVALALAGLICAAWAALTIPMLTGLAVVVPYYREPAIVVMVMAAAGMAYALVGAVTNRRGFAVGSLVALALGLKIAHAGLYVPEWNYRFGAGPWGRAIGQWVPPRQPIHVFHAERADLMFATGREVQELVAPAWLEFVETPRPHYVLLLASEFEHWPAEAPKIEKIRDFEDERGNVRTLARTLEPLQNADPATP